MVGEDALDHHAEMLLRQADERLYVSKSRGRHQACGVELVVG